MSGARLCVAYSGGADSTALLCALAGLRRRQRCALRAVHVNHGLQAGAGAWAEAAAQQARAWGVPLEVVDVVVPRERGVSLEAAARAARYAALAARLAPGEWLLTAHNQDDQLETILLQLVRGSGLRGLAAMPERVPFGAGLLLRPLLPWSRAELQRYLEAEGVRWLEDPSNRDERFDRNYLRSRVVPALRERWPAVAATASRSARHVAAAQAQLAAGLDRLLDVALDGPALKLAVVRRQPPAVRRALLRHWLLRQGYPSPDERRLEELAGRFLQARADAQPVLRWEGCELRRHDDRLYAAAGPPALPPGVPLRWPWRARRALALPDGAQLRLLDDRHGDVALARLEPRLQLRFRAGGERLAGPGGRRALKDLLQQARLAPWQRPLLPLVCAGEEIVAVPGLWVAPRLRPGPGEQRRARFVWTPPRAVAG